MCVYVRTWSQLHKSAEAGGTSEKRTKSQRHRDKFAVISMWGTDRHISVLCTYLVTQLHKSSEAGGAASQQHRGDGMYVLPACEPTTYCEPTQRKQLYLRVHTYVSWSCQGTTGMRDLRSRRRHSRR